MKDNKEKIIIASLKLFAEKGVSATTTRMIANKAGLNLGLIPYYFGSKDKLYLEVILHISKIMQSGVKIDHQSVMASLIKSPTDKQELIDILTDVMTSILNNLLSSEYSQSIALIMAREQASPTPAFDYIYENIVSKIQGVLVLIICKIVDDNEVKDQHYIMLNMLIGQVNIFLMSRASIFKSLKIDQYEKKHIDMISKYLEKNIKNMFAD